MANKTINTRIVLRNDYLSAWNTSDKKLLKGEVALALREDGKYEVRIGTGDKTWSALSTDNIVLSANNILGLENYINKTIKDTNTTYKIVSTDLTGSETGSSFVLQSHELSDATGTWTNVEGSRFNVPAFDSAAFKTEIETEIAAVSSDTLTKANAYTDAEIKKVNDAIKDGVHFIGKVDSKTEDGKYTIDGTTKAANNGDIIIIDKAEYIYSSALSAWQELGDEGTIASKEYVDTAANTAKEDAIKATKNKVTEVASEAALPTTDNVAGDIAVVTTQIGTTGKCQYKGFAWTGTKWQAMDGDYSTEHVIMPDDMTITYDLGKYTIPASGSLKLNCAGKTLKEFLDDAFAKVQSGTRTLPDFSFTAGGNRTGEIGTTYVLPSATLTMTSIGSYQYAPTTATGVKVEVGNATVKCTTTGYTDVVKNNTAEMVKNSTLSTDAGTTAITYLSTVASYAFSAEATYTDGAVPKNNIGGDDASMQIKSAKVTKTATASFTGQYPAYYGFTTTPTSNPTAIAANNGNVTSDGVTYTRALNNFNMTSFTASGKWYELFYMIPAGNHASWSGKDSNNVDLAVEAKTQATVTFKDNSTATYDVFVVRNAAQYSATTCKMTFK